MDKERKSPKQYGSLDSTKWSAVGTPKDTDIVSMADSTTTVDDIEDELFKIERIREVLVRRESELRYMMDDIQLCKEITRLKKELQKLVSVPAKDRAQQEPCSGFQSEGGQQEGFSACTHIFQEHACCGAGRHQEKDKSTEDKQKEDELLQQIHKLVETRDFLVDDVEFERLREKEEDKEMAEFLNTKLSKSCFKDRSTQRKEKKKMTSRAQQTSTPYATKTGLTLLKECCGFTCSIM